MNSSRKSHQTKTYHMSYFLALWAKNMRNLWQKLIENRWFVRNSSKSSHYGPIYQNYFAWWIQNLRKTHNFPWSKKHTDKAKFRFQTLNCLLSSTKLWERGPSKNASSFLTFWPGLTKWKVSINFELEVDIVRSHWPFFWASKTLLRSCLEK